MATTSAQDKDFLATVISATLLEETITWIQRNMVPQDVFDEDVLADWARSNGFTDVTED